MRKSNSLICPVHSGCINSCLSQTCKDVEIILGDDASMDTTSDYILSLRDKRLKYIKRAVNRGPAAEDENMAQPR